MFERQVRMPSGNVLNKHRIREIRHSIDENATAVDVESYDETTGLSESYGYSHEFEVGLTFDEAEQWVKELDTYRPYVDEGEERLLEILTDEQAATVVDAFPLWSSDVDYSVGYRVRYGGILYKCLQAHTSQDNWTPDTATSLWARILNPDPEVIPVWEQPDSTNPYMTGDKVHYPDTDGPIYESTIDGNIWSPEAYPQGWQLVEGGE